MKYCSKCGKELVDDAVVCTGCGCAQDNPAAEGTALGTLAIVFSVLGGWLGFILAIIGLCTYKLPENKKKCKIALIICGVWVVLWILIFAITLGSIASLAASQACLLFL